MRSDSPGAIMGALGLLDDDMAELLPGYAEAAGWMAEFAQWERTTYLVTKEEMRGVGLLDDCKTETSIKDAVELEMSKRYSSHYDEAKKMKRLAAYGAVLFKGQDARRSIGQSLLKRHSEADGKDQYGQGRGQVGQ